MSCHPTCGEDGHTNLNAFVQRIFAIRLYRCAEFRVRDVLFETSVAACDRRHVEDRQLREGCGGREIGDNKINNMIPISGG